MPDIMTAAQVAECQEKAERVRKSLAAMSSGLNPDEARAIVNEWLEAIKHQPKHEEVLALCDTIEALREVVREVGESEAETVYGPREAMTPHFLIPRNLILRARELSR
jgi:polyhydroxyalkanoate synthesis regulator phasin